jgi:hypothetical protein
VVAAAAVNVISESHFNKSGVENITNYRIAREVELLVVVKGA